MPNPYRLLSATLLLVTLSGCDSGAEFLGVSALVFTIGAIACVALIIFAAIDLLGNNMGFVPKLLWAALIIFAPFIGAILYLLIGKR